MDPQQAQTIAHRFIDELHRLEHGDQAGVDGLVSLFADDAELTNPILERNGSARQGRQAIADFWREYRGAFGEIESEFFDVIASDHSAGLFWRSTGTGPNGEPLNYEGVSLLAFDDSGKIARFQGFFDTGKLTFRHTAH